MNDLERGERLQIMLSPAELNAVEDWRFAKRMPSRAAAVRELLRRGLAADGFQTAEPGAKSQEFGVVSPDGAGPDGEEGQDARTGERPSDEGSSSPVA